MRSRATRSSCTTLLDVEDTATERRRLRFANFRLTKTLEEFDFSAQRSLDRRLVDELATLRFITEKANLLLAAPVHSAPFVRARLDRPALDRLRDAAEAGALDPLGLARPLGSLLAAVVVQLGTTVMAAEILAAAGLSEGTARSLAAFIGLAPLAAMLVARWRETLADARARESSRAARMIGRDIGRPCTTSVDG